MEEDEDYDYISAVMPALLPASVAFLNGTTMKVLI